MIQDSDLVPEKNTENDETTPESAEAYLSSRKRLIFGVPDLIFQPLAVLQQKETALRAPLDAFRQNLTSALMVGSIPFQLAHSSVLNLRFSQIHGAERIRTLIKDEVGNQMNEASRETTALEIARKRMAEETSDKIIIENLARRTLQMLHSHIMVDEFSTSCDELLRQVLVMSWGAFETFVNDLVRLILNLRPNLIKDLSSVRPFKDFLTGKTLIEGLESAQFDLSKGMGDFISDLITLDSVEKIQAVTAVLFQSSVLDIALKNAQLWQIAQQRHLIVHRRSVVDLRYRERTGDTTEIGMKLTLDSNYVEQSISILISTASLFFEAACAKLEELN